MTTVKYETPRRVALALARHSPKAIRYLLDPAVGGGALLKPLISKLSADAAPVVCVDIDRNALLSTKRTLERNYKISVETRHGSFLSLIRGALGVQWTSHFDCVIMNPPYAGRKENSVRIRLNDAARGNYYTPIEAAFVVRAIPLLKDGGSLIAVLPSSIVSSESLLWLRQHLNRMGCVRYVHELPRRTFRGVEGKMYLLVFKKSERGKRITLCNHDLYRPAAMRVTTKELQPWWRLDYSYYRAIRDTNRRVARTCALGWTSLGSVAQVLRGDKRSPNGKEYAVHTCDCGDGIWQISKRHRIYLRRRDRVLQRGDLLMMRVGRRCSESAGVPTRYSPVMCTDCVFIIRPRIRSNRNAILLALRVALGGGRGAALLERGSGAAYITKKSLLNLLIPLRMKNHMPNEFRRYCTAVKNGSVKRIHSIEDSARSLMCKARN